jgi:hypothetical protein
MVAITTRTRKGCQAFRLARHIHAEIATLGPHEGLSDEELEDLREARPGTLPWERRASGSGPSIDAHAPEGDDDPRAARVAAVTLPGLPRARAYIVPVGRTEEAPVLAAAGTFADNPFADEVDACITEERRRQRQEADRDAVDEDR